MRNNEQSAVEREEARLEQRLATAWTQYQPTEPKGLDFGKVCFVCHTALEGTRGKKGQGWRPLLERQKIPFSTANFWEKRYKDSQGIVDVQEPPSPEAAQYDALAEKLYQSFIDRAIPVFNVTWAPITAKTDADIRDFGSETHKDRFRVTLFLRQADGERLALVLREQQETEHAHE